MPDGMAFATSAGDSDENTDGASGMVTDSSGGTGDSQQEQEQQPTQDHGDHSGAYFYSYA